VPLTVRRGRFANAKADRFFAAQKLWSAFLTPVLSLLVH